MKTLIATVLGATMLYPVAALAGGMTTPVTEPVVVPVAVIAEVTPDWTGFYGGAQLGYGSIDSTEGVADGSGWLGGLMAGYRYDFGTFVTGIEGDYSWSNIDLDSGDDEGSLDDLYHIKLQAGADLGQTFLYGTAGWAWAKGNFAGEGDTVDGWVAGVGADYDIGNNWTVGAEVLYNSFDDVAGTDINADGTTVMMRAAYRF